VGSVEVFDVDDFRVPVLCGPNENIPPR
jgi:hypothetical protein